MSPTIALIIGVCTATIPLMASSALLWARIVARPAELARVLFVTSLSLFCLLAGPWAWLTYWLRLFALLVLVAAIIRSGRRLIRNRPAKATNRRLTAAVAIGGLAFLVLDVVAIVGLSGNHVVLRCDAYDDVSVLLAHLRIDSVQVRTGDRVSAGQVIAAVGNSGNSSEPHLHVQATRGAIRDGSPVSVLFEGHFLTSNQLVLGK